MPRTLPAVRPGAAPTCGGDPCPGIEVEYVEIGGNLGVGADRHAEQIGELATLPIIGTAVRTALWRALHMLVDQSPPVLADTLGLRIADVDDSWRQRPDMDPVRMSTNRASIVARSRLAEDVVSASGATQYVILGAGLDTFAQWHDGPTQVFEIDAPATSAWKRDRLDALGLRAAERLHLVPVDFEAGESWLDQVVTAGLDPAIPTVVSMLGVTMYLSREAISATLCAAATLAAGSTMVFSYSRPIEMAPA